MRINPWVYRLTGLMALLGLLALLLGLIVMFLLPPLRYAALAILALGIGLLTTGFILDFRRVSRAITGRRGRLGIGTTVMVSIFIGIVLLVNAISIGNYKRFDVTALSEFTLSTQTKEVLSKLATPVKALGFFVPGDPIGAYTNNLLTEYAYYTERLSIDFIDPDEHPDQARKYGITQYQTVVFESQNRWRLVLPDEITAGAEHAFTSAILEVTGIAQKKVYFLTGHDEVNLAATDSKGFSNAREGLLNELYLIDTLNLLTTPAIPRDCAALVIAAPQKALMTSEVEIIDRYLKKGGQVLILANPASPPEVGQIISRWGINLAKGTVIDPSSYVAPNKNIPSVTAERSAFSLPITYFPGATAIIPQEKTTIEMLPLIYSSKEAWLEQDFDPKKEPVFNEDSDLKGPLALGVLIAAAPLEPSEEASSEETKLTRLVVIGDSDFASNEHYFNGNNSDLFLNSVNWLAEETELIAIRRQVLPFRRLIVGPEATRFINYSSIGLLPLLVLVLGGIIWWHRR